MIDFSTMNALRIPEGDVIKIEVDGSTIWDNIKFRYVTLGDSVGAGYGVERDEDNFTGLIDSELETIYGANRVSTKNQAIGGHQVIELVDRLDDITVKNDVKKANLVTISIGGNDLLQMSGNITQFITDYITSGDLTAIKNVMRSNLERLKKEADTKDVYDPKYVEVYSYASLLKKLIRINENATYVFTTQYNPYKYLWIEEGRQGFLKPLFDAIPEGLAWAGGPIEKAFFSVPFVNTFFSRVNGLDAFVEELINELNSIMTNAIGEFKEDNPSAKILLADTKVLYDTIPDRIGAGDIHYNDLVHVEFSRGYNVGDINWGRMWNNTLLEDFDGNVLSNTRLNSADTFWRTLWGLYIDDLNIEGLVTTLLAMIKEYILMPDIDLHPKEDGYYLLMRSFADVLHENISELSALPALKTITYNANNGSGDVATQKVLDKSRGKNINSILNTNTFIPVTGCGFIGWNTNSSGSGTMYANGQAIGITADNTVLYAQWEWNKHSVYITQINNANFDNLLDADNFAYRTAEINYSSIPELLVTSGAQQFMGWSQTYEGRDIQYLTNIKLTAKCKYKQNQSTLVGPWYKYANCNIVTRLAGVEKTIASNHYVGCTFDLPDCDVYITFTFVTTGSVYDPFDRATVVWNIMIESAASELPNFSITNNETLG